VTSKERKLLEKNKKTPKKFIKSLDDIMKSIHYFLLTLLMPLIADIDTLIRRLYLFHEFIGMRRKKSVRGVLI